MKVLSLTCCRYSVCPRVKHSHQFKHILLTSIQWPKVIVLNTLNQILKQNKTNNNNKKNNSTFQWVKNKWNAHVLILEASSPLSFRLSSWDSSQYSIDNQWQHFYNQWESPATTAMSSEDTLVLGCVEKCSSMIESVVNFAIITWFGRQSIGEENRLHIIVPVARKIIGV